MKTKFYLLLFIALVKFAPSEAQNKWVLRTKNDGVTIYESEVPGSKIKALKVIATFNATPMQVGAVIMDVKAATEWVYRMRSSILIKRVSPNELYYYSEVNLPWPAANRDFVAHLTLKQNPETKVVEVDGPAVPGLMQLKAGIVRINNSVGKWIITPVGINQVQVEYTLHVDPAGSLPSWLVNSFATDAPLRIFKNLRVELQKSTYKNSDLLLSDN